VVLAAPPPREEELRWPAPGLSQVRVYRGAGVVRQLELHRPLRLALANARALDRIAMRSDIGHAEGHQIATAKLAIYRGIEEGEVSHLLEQL
jgi:hypothetical protein